MLKVGYQHLRQMSATAVAEGVIITQKRFYIWNRRYFYTSNEVSPRLALLLKSEAITATHN